MWFVTFSSLDRGSLAWKIVIINHTKTSCSQKKVELTSSVMMPTNRIKSLPEKIRLLYTSPPHCSGFKAASLPLVCLLCNFYTFCFETLIRNTKLWEHCTNITTITSTAILSSKSSSRRSANQPTNQPTCSSETARQLVTAAPKLNLLACAVQLGSARYLGQTSSKA